MRIFIDYEIFFKLNIVTVALLVESCATVFLCLCVYSIGLHVLIIQSDKLRVMCFRN